MNSRTERDSFGNIEVLTNHFWGAQTQRSLLHFHISTERMPEEIIFALAEVKRACANTPLFETKEQTRKELKIVPTQLWVRNPLITKNNTLRFFTKPRMHPCIV
jgi:fumarate hydratase class II